jgi:hypothetical protein
MRNRTTRIVAVAAAGIVSLGGIAACGDDDDRDVGEQIEDTVDDVGDEIEDTFDDDNGDDG